MARKNKKIILLTFLEIFQKQRVQVVTGKGGPHRSEKDYNRQKDKEALRKECF